ncbi:MAG: DNA repair protein RecN [Verrucomicrobia bacterium]|nr:DNA repair protein RecN [Verrucomicrobiota bacterium]MCF7707484.1 DNA repair protein RecN [Verrucomicrobiota bacterium]
MLSTLRIRNFALVDELTIEFNHGLNAVTGETGAGKSIIIGALGLILGERAGRNSIRSGCDSATVEAAFSIHRMADKIDELLESRGLETCENGQLLLKRSFSLSGTNRQFINGSPTTLSILQAVGDLLVDIHGPHDHQSLLHPSRQLEILDAFGKLKAPRNEFAALVNEYRRLIEKKRDLIVDERTYAQQLDMLRFQVNEIESAHIKLDEEAAVEEEYKKTSNASRLLEISQSALHTLSESEISLIDLAGHLGKSLHELTELDPSIESISDTHSQAMALLQDIQDELAGYIERLNLDPEHLQSLESRISLIQNLKRKYGPSLEDVVDYLNNASQKLAELESRDAELEKLDSSIRKLQTQLRQSGNKLSAQRKKTIPRLQEKVQKHLKDLGFQQSRFNIQIKNTNPSLNSPERIPPSTGFDTIEFLFTPNPGEPPRQLRAIASSGEMARVMLALKTVLAAEDEIPVLIFDEVDANVGGETAHAVGLKLKTIAENRQVLCITHLAPVASFASSHYRVSKEMTQNRTISVLEHLDNSSRIDELARMLGGRSTEARKHAESLLKNNGL